MPTPGRQSQPLSRNEPLGEDLLAPFMEAALRAR